MTEKRALYVKLIRQGVSNSEACRRLGIDRKTGHWWKNGGVIARNGGVRVVEPIIDKVPIAAELGRAVSTVSRELARNRTADGDYRPHQAQAMMVARRARPKRWRLEFDGELRRLVQHYLDQRWSPEQIAHVLRDEHCRPIAVETIYQALYSPHQVLQRDG